MAYNPMYEPTDENTFKVVVRDLDKCKYVYPDYQEIMSRHMPEALSTYVVIKAYVDANHAGNIINWRSHYGIIVYVNNAPIIWYSKL